MGDDVLLRDVMRGQDLSLSAWGFSAAPGIGWTCLSVDRARRIGTAVSGLGIVLQSCSANKKCMSGSQGPDTTFYHRRAAGLQRPQEHW